jgi:hypothetical protein
MRRSNVFLIAVLVVLILMFAFTRTLRGQNTTSRDLQLNQSRMNSYQADKKSYNNSPYAKPDDGYNKWLNSQMERTQKDRNQIIERGFRERDSRRGR